MKHIPKKFLCNFFKILTNSINTLKIHNLTFFASWMLISKYAELIWQHCSCVKGSWLKIALTLHLQITTICSSPPPPAWQCQADRIIPMMSGNALLSTHLCWMRNSPGGKGIPQTRVGIALGENERSDLCREGAGGKAEIGTWRRAKSSGEDDVRLPQARSDLEKDGQSWGAGVLMSVPLLDPPCASGLGQLRDVNLPVEVAQCLIRSLTGEGHEIAPPQAESSVYHHQTTLPLYNKS